MLNEKTFKAIYDDFLESGLSVRSYCLNQSINEAKFYYWQRRLKNLLPPRKGFVPLLIEKDRFTERLCLRSSMLGQPEAGPEKGATCEISYPSWVQKERNCRIATRNHRLDSIHSLVSYLQYEDLHHLDEWQKIRSIKTMKDEKKSINYLTTEGIKLLLEQPDSTTGNGRRNLALLALMYDTGARVQEMIDLTPESLKIEATP